MGYHEFRQSREILMGKGQVDPPFYALIMAAMRKADTRNLNALKEKFPGVWKELKARYVAPAGFLSEAEAKFYDKELEDEDLSGWSFPEEGYPRDEYP